MGAGNISHRIIYVTILLLVALIVIVIALNGELGQKDVGTALLALMGTFLGATFAFRLNEDKEREKELALNRAALNRSLFVLSRQYNALHQLHSEMSKYKSPFERAFNMPAFQPPNHEDLSHQFNDLEFLIELHPNLLLLLSVEQERFHQALESLRVRNGFYVNEVQIALSGLSLNGKRVSSDEMAALLGDRLFNGSMSGAETAYMHVAESVNSIKEMHIQLHQCAKKLFPGHKFISYEMPT